MRTIKLTAIILIALAAYFFIKADWSFNIIQALPFADGEKWDNPYHFGALAIIGLTIYAYYRITRQKDD